MEKTCQKRRWKPIALAAAALTAAAASVFRPDLDTSISRDSRRRTRSRALAEDEPCSSSSWHVSTDPSEFDTCTNSADYPSEWDRPDMRDLMVFSNRKKCCKALEPMIGVACRVKDVCDGTTAVEAATTTTSTTSTTRTSKSGKEDVVPLDTTTSTSTTSTSTTSTSTTTTTTTSKSTPTQKIFYPVLQSNLCLSDSRHSQVSPLFRFTTPEDCCASGWLDYDTCLSRTIQNLYASAPTTPEPSLSPVTEYPTWSPTQYNCAQFHNLWHMSATKLFSCTNDDTYPKEWMLEPESYLFSSGKDCCTARFPGKACTMTDVCAPTKMPTRAPTLRPTARPTKSPTHSPTISISPTVSPVFYSKGECNSNKWHKAQDEEKTCSNDKNYPSTWDHPTLSGYFLRDSPEGCCELNNFGRPGRECIIYDICDEVTNPPTENPTPRPTPRPTRDPSATVKPTHSPASTPPSPKPTPSTKPTPPAKPVTEKPVQSCGMWHPGTGAAYKDKSCTNGQDDYPAIWNTFNADARSKVFFETAELCCLDYWGKECKMIDFCDPSGTGGDNPGTEDQGSNQVPTNKPTSKPSGGSDPIDDGELSTVQNDCRLWHPVTVTDGGPKSCSNGKGDYPKAWDNLATEQKGTVFFGSADDCCLSYWKQSCEHDDHGCENTSEGDPPSGGGSDPTNEEAGCGLWHPGTNAEFVCSNGKGDYPKSWDELPASQKGTVFFSSADECCTSYWRQSCQHDDHCKSSGTEPQDSNGVRTDKPTNKPTMNSIAQNDGDAITSLGTDGFEDPSSSFPWQVGDPPQWIITDKAAGSGSHSMVSVPVNFDDPAKTTSTLSLKANLSQSAKIKCSVKVDTMMPFDWFSLRINGKVKYPYYSTSNHQWTVFGTSISAGQNLIEFVVERGPNKPSFDRSSGLGYGSGNVWLDDCEITKA